MNDWKEIELGNFVEVLSSKRIFAADYVLKGIPFYRSKEIIEKSKGEKISTPLFITKNRFEDIKNNYGAPSDGDLLLSAVGERAGIPYYVKNDDQFYFKDGNLIWFRKFKDELNSKFLCYFLKSRIGQHKLDSIMIGSAQKALTIVGLKGMVINLPPLSEQKAIANVLTSFDNKIELLQQQNQTLETIAQTIFAAWFGKYKVDDELPKGWRVGKLGEIGSIICGKTPSKAIKENFEGNIPFIKIPDMHNQMFITNTSDTLSEKGANTQKNKFIKKGSICVSCIATVGLVSITSEESQTNQQINTIVPFKSNFREFIYFSIKNIYKYLQDIGSGGTATLNINTTSFTNIEIVIPEQNSLIKFHITTKPLLDKILDNMFQIQSLTKTRDTLLPKLMSGALRVSEVKTSTN